MSDCAVWGCKPEPGASIHYLPKSPVLKQTWMDFIYRNRFSRPSRTGGIRICGAHFSNDCFVNFIQRSMGFAKKLILKPDAVPSIYPGSPTVLQYGAAALCLKGADEASRCNSVVEHEDVLRCSFPHVSRTRSQLSDLTYRRNLGVQTKMPTTGAATAEQSVVSRSQKPPTDRSQPETEAEDRCLTAVTLLLLKSLEEITSCVVTALQKTMSVRI